MRRPVNWKKRQVTDVFMDNCTRLAIPPGSADTGHHGGVFCARPFTSVQHRAGSDAAETAWFSVFDLPDLAFDHHEIITYALQRLRYKLEYTMVGFELLPDEFTLSQLQQAYEITLQEPLDKRNFRRKILSAEIIEETGRKRQEGRASRQTVSLSSRCSRGSKNAPSLFVTVAVRPKPERFRQLRTQHHFLTTSASASAH